MTILRVYGPGGPYGPMLECAREFSQSADIDVVVSKGTPEQWIDRAREDADLIYWGAEYMLSDFAAQHPGLIDMDTVSHLYPRSTGIIVRKSNPAAIRRLADLGRRGIRLLNVELENMGEFQGRMPGVMENISRSVLTGTDGLSAWKSAPELDAWITYESWYFELKSSAEFIRFERGCSRWTPIAITTVTKNKMAASEFIRFLKSEDGHKIFTKWGWQ